MKAVIEKTHLTCSIANYPTCVIVYPFKTIERLIKRFGFFRKGRARQWRAMADFGACITAHNRKIAAKMLGSDRVENESFIFCAVSYLFYMRRLDWEEQAEQSLIDMGMDREDILNGRDLPFTDHTGIFMPKELPDAM